MKKIIAIAAVLATAQASAWWGGNNWGNNYNNGYGYGDGWGRGYNYSAPYWGGPYAYAPYAPLAPVAPQAEAAAE